MVKKIDFLTGIVRTMKAAVTGNPYRESGNFFNDQWSGIEVDTCIAHDTEEWETGIDRGSCFKIAEQYSDESAAIAGHKKWVDALKADPDMELPDLVFWEGF